MICFVLAPRDQLVMGGRIARRRARLWTSEMATSSREGSVREGQTRPRGTLRVPAVLAVVVLASLWLFVLKPKGPGSTPHAITPWPARMPMGVEKDQAAIDKGSISGFVRSQEGQAIENSQVCATTVSSEVFWTPNVSCATTDSGGGYRIQPLASTAYVVSAAAGGYQPVSALLGATILLDRGEAKTGVDIALPAGGAKLSGWVRDATGAPISGAKIRVLRQALPHDTVVATSGPDGRFATWCVPGPVTVLADARDHVRARVAHVAPSSDLVLTLVPGATISGRVVADATGAPVASVVVRAVQSRSWNNPTQPSGTSDSEGRFEIQGLEPNAYTLIGEGRGWYGALRTAGPRGLAQHMSGVTLTVSAAAVVTGRVIRHGGKKPCSQGIVILGPNKFAPAGPAPGNSRTREVPTVLGELQADGTIRFNAVPVGHYRVDVQCTDFVLRDGPTTLEVGRSDLDGLVWQVDPGVRMTVKALNERNQPAANTHLCLSSDGANNGSMHELHRSPIVTDAEGKYELKGLSPSVYTVEPDTGYEGQPVTVDARHSEKVDVNIRLKGRGSILVTVQTPDGAGVDQVDVSAVAWDQGARPAADRDARAPVRPPLRIASKPVLRSAALGTALGNGHFQIGPLAAGPYRVRVNDGINPPAEPTDGPHGAVLVHAGVAQATVILRRSGSIRGRVVDSSGQAAPDLWVTANCSLRRTDNDPGNLAPRVPLTRRPSRVVTDSEGRFRIDGLDSDAHCAVRAEQPGGSIGVAASVHPGDDIVVTLPPLGSLSGTARRADGSPAANFTLAMRDPDIGVARSETVFTREGRWSLARVVPGHLQLSAFESSAGVAEARIELAPGEQRDGIELQFRASPLQSFASEQPNP